MGVQTLCGIDAIVMTDDVHEQGKEQIFGGDRHACGLCAQLMLQARKALLEFFVVAKAVGEIFVARSEQVQKFYAFRTFPKQFCLELHVEQIHFLTDLGDTVRLVATEQKNVARFEVVLLAVHGVRARASKENGDLTFGVMVVQLFAFLGF